MKNTLLDMLFVGSLLLTTTLFNGAHATLINDRNQLDTLLGSAAITEDFESLVQSSGSATSKGSVVNSLTDIGGLVIEGVEFTNINSKRQVNSIQWNAAGYFGQSSQNITAEGGTLRVDFLNNVNAFGLDLGVFNNYADSATIVVFGTDDSSVLASFTGIGLGSVGALDTFWGVYDLGDIGAFEVSGTRVWSPLVDNVSFNYLNAGSGGSTNPIPEPSMWLIFALALTGLFVRKVK